MMDSRRNPEGVPLPPVSPLVTSDHRETATTAAHGHKNQADDATSPHPRRRRRFMIAKKGLGD